MDYLTRGFHVLKGFLVIKKKNEVKLWEITRFERYWEYVYEVLAWSDIAVTLRAFLLVNFVYWLIVSWDLHILGLIFLSILSMFVLDAYYDYNHPQVYSRREHLDSNKFCKLVKDILMSWIHYREENRFSFCFTNCILFFVIFVISKSMPEYLLIYLVILLVFFVPLGMQSLPREVLQILSDTFHQLYARSVLAEEELMPFIANKLFNDRDPDLDSLLTDRTQDSLTNSLTTDIASMPSYLDVNDDAQSPSFTPTIEFSDTDDEPDRIYFHTKHFNGNSSSEDENQYSKGLRFTEVVLDRTRQMINNTISQRSAFQRTHSDSDFEFVNEDDIDEQNSS